MRLPALRAADPHFHPGSFFLKQLHSDPTLRACVWCPAKPHTVHFHIEQTARASSSGVCAFSC